MGKKILYDGWVIPPTEENFGFGYRLKIEEDEETGKVKRQHMYSLPNVVQVMGLTEGGEVIAIHEWQSGLESFYTHLVGGTVQGKETPEETARRELLEETGYLTGRLTLLTTLLQDTGRSDRKQFLFLAEDCKKFGPGEKEIKVKLFTPEEFWKFLMTYFLTNPEKAHGGGNSLSTAVLAFQKLGFIALDMSSFARRITQ